MPSEDVIKAFKKFDKDGNGVISRSELSMVLKNLSDTWDDDSVERLMNKADKNGDGVLQIEEFVNWLFAALEVDPTLKDAANLVASCPEEQGRMIGELFAFFDIDSDRYWNFKEADYCVVATEGKHLDEFSWKQMLHVAPPEFVDKGKQALSLEGMVWYYLNPEFEFNIEKDYLSVFTKVKMVQELFDFFDLDKDGYWNFTESWECSFATDESAGQNHTEEMFAWLVNELMPADEKSKGLSRKCVVDVYCQPMHSRFEMNIAKDHEALQVYKKKLATEIFENYDADKDGYWNFQEAQSCNKETGETTFNEEEYMTMVEFMQPGNEDKSKGLSKETVVNSYLDPKHQQNALKDHKRVHWPDRKSVV